MDSKNNIMINLLSYLSDAKDCWRLEICPNSHFPFTWAVVSAS